MVNPFHTLSRRALSVGFGGDSAIELFFAIIVLWRSRSKSDSAVAKSWLLGRPEVRSSLSLPSSSFSSGLSFLGYREPLPSFGGIILLGDERLRPALNCNDHRSLHAEPLTLRNRVLVQFAERLVVAVIPLRFTPTVVVPEAKVIARPALTGAFAIVATVGTVELQ